MVRSNWWTLVALGTAAAACGESDSKSPASNHGGTAGAAGSGATAGSSGGGNAGSGGASGASAAASGMAGAAGSGTTVPCPDDRVDCNGTCVGVGVSGGGCTVLSAAAGAGVTIALGMALDDQYVYWSEEGTHIAVARAPKTGGPREELVECDDLPYELSVNSTSVLWSEGGFDTNRVRMVPKAGGSVVDLLTQSDEIHPVVADDTRVYFMSGPFFEPKDVVSIGFAGNDTITHAQDDGSSSSLLVVSDSNLYWASETSQIRKTTLTGTEQTTLGAGAIALMTSMTLMGDALYAIGGFSGEQSIQRVALADGQLTLVYFGSEVGGRLAASGSTLYFATSDSLYSLAQGATTSQKVLTTQGGIGYLAADASGVYLALNHAQNSGQGFIVKVQ